jgi:hypothetical protein
MVRINDQPKLAGGDSELVLVVATADDLLNAPSQQIHREKAPACGGRRRFSGGIMLDRSIG